MRSGANNKRAGSGDRYRSESRRPLANASVSWSSRGSPNPDVNDTAVCVSFDDDTMISIEFSVPLAIRRFLRQNR